LGGAYPIQSSNIVREGKRKKEKKIRKMEKSYMLEESPFFRVGAVNPRRGCGVPF